jgi:hypothetical protein
MIWKLLFTPLGIPIMYGESFIITLQFITERAGVKAPPCTILGSGPVLSNGVYSNRLDQAGLDSPPFDGVKAL